MKMRILAVSALAGLASAGFVLAGVVEGPDLTATGTVVSSGNASLVLKTDDHGHTVPFVIGATTDLPQGLEPGSRVTVHYRAVGTDQQMADQIVLLEPAAPTPSASARNGLQAPASPAQPAAPASAQPPTQTPTDAPSPTTPEAPRDTELPGTASPIPLMGLLGLAALLGSAALRALERR